MAQHEEAENGKSEWYRHSMKRVKWFYLAFLWAWIVLELHSNGIVWFQMGNVAQLYEAIAQQDSFQAEALFRSEIIDQQIMQGFIWVRNYKMVAWGDLQDLTLTGFYMIGTPLPPWLFSIVSVVLPLSFLVGFGAVFFYALVAPLLGTAKLEPKKPPFFSEQGFIERIQLNLIYIAPFFLFYLFYY